MSSLVIALILFILLETMNVMTLYFIPGSRKANGVGVFNAAEQAKAYPELYDFVRYLIYWVAGGNQLAAIYRALKENLRAHHFAYLLQNDAPEGFW